MKTPNTHPRAPVAPLATLDSTPAPNPSWFKKAICTLFSVALINTLAIPLTQAMQIERHKQALQNLYEQAQNTGPAERYAQAFDWLEYALAQSGHSGNTPNTEAPQLPALPPGMEENPTLLTLSGLAEHFSAQAQALQDEWAELHQLWQDAGVDAAILARQRQIEADFSAAHQQLMGLLQAAAAQNSPSEHTQAQQALADFLQAQRPRRTHLPIDLDNLPWQVLRPNPTEPADNAEQLQARLSAEDETPKTQANKPNKPNKRPVTHRQAIDTDKQPQKEAQETPAEKTKTATAPTAADLAATAEAPHSPAIVALAQSLDNNPFKIHQWVYDHIHYLPSHGSVQGAQDTLDKQRGNALDTASLLIALLRASGIPARYVYGTVDIPAERVQNWVGGAATADAAQQILSQGGVPNTILTRAGVDYAFRLEHVWVEAFIQYHPSRGTVHTPGQGDTWVPLDASFKRFEHTPGMDLQTAVPFDAQALITAAQQGAQINETEGWVRHLNTHAVETRLRTYQNQLQTHIQSQNGGQSTVGDVLGTRKPRIYSLPYLAGSLPYTVRARSQAFATIPAALKTRFKYEIYADQRSAAWGDNPLLSWQTPTAELAGKKLTIAWVAATAADQHAIEALIPTPPAGQELDPSQLPKGLPGSIHLTPEIRLDGQTVATGTAMRAGAEPIGVGGYTQYRTGQWDTSQDQLIAGQQTAIGISIQGLSHKQMERLKERMEQTKAKLEQAQAAPASQRPTILQGITGEHLTGDMLTATVWGYFASLQSYGSIAGSQAQVIDLPALQYGLFHAQVQPRKPFGLVTTGISFKGLNMDIGHVRSIRWVKDDDPQSPINKPELRQNGRSAAQNRWIAYNKIKGNHSSAMEHAVPEDFWINKSQCRHIGQNGQVQNPTLQPCVEGISAVKAIAIAQQQGQKVYTINPENRATALPRLTIGGEAGTEIRNAIQAGKEVTFHEARINEHGWSGYGYSIVDPETGVGGYLIEGKGNGGFLLGILNGFGFLALISAWTIGAVGWPTLVLSVLLVASVIFTAIVLYAAENGADVAACYSTGLNLAAPIYALVAAIIMASAVAMGISISAGTVIGLRGIINAVLLLAFAAHAPAGAPYRSCL